MTKISDEDELKKLEELRFKGLITEDEFVSERNNIILRSDKNEADVLYRQSNTLFAIYIIWDLLLSCIGIGLILIPIHLLQRYNSSLTLGSKGLILRLGILSTVLHEIRYDKINSITVKQSTFGNLLGYGSLVILTGNEVSALIFKDLDNPHRIKKEIEARIDNLK